MKFYFLAKIILKIINYSDAIVLLEVPLRYYYFNASSSLPLRYRSKKIRNGNDKPQRFVNGELTVCLREGNSVFTVRLGERYLGKGSYLHKNDIIAVVVLTRKSELLIIPQQCIFRIHTIKYKISGKWKSFKFETFQESGHFKKEIKFFNKN